MTLEKTNKQKPSFNRNTEEESGTAEVHLPPPLFLYFVVDRLEELDKGSELDRSYDVRPDRVSQISLGFQ